ERVSMPGIGLSLFAARQAVNQVDDERQLPDQQADRGYRRDHMKVLHRLQELVRTHFVYSPRISFEADHEERNEDAVETDEGEEEMNFAQRLVHHFAEHLREPVIDAGEAAEECHREKRVVEMRDDEVRAVQE